ncbi:MAG: MaoC family dehydratase N-terminal domain-containing protein [Caulobacteraceae bacterium]|nr:MaoC family dehydratase N-terminal domain-containing protein [Caulobacteraceae bacterium]
MTDAPTTREVRDIDASISEADIERARKQIGIPQFSPNKPWNYHAGRDSMEHFAYGMVGDDNPLYRDPEYARKTRWRALIGHPLYVGTMGEREAPPYTPELKALFRGLFRGVGKYHSGSDWEFFRPVYEGERIFSEYITKDVQVKQSTFSGGISVLDTYRETYFDVAGIPVAYHDILFINAERKGSASSGRYKDVKRATYTPDDIARIEEIYAAETRRGPEERLWEDVEVGESLGQIAKGPFTMVDLLGRHVATGIGAMYQHGPLKYAHQMRKKMPAFYTADEYGVPQVQQRVHWDDARARDLGLPTSYDYGAMRTAWQAHLITNWMGDDAWMWKFHSEVRLFAFMGDTHIVSGEVTAKRVEDEHHVVDVAVRCVNQRGETTAPGHATLILPSREYGPAVLPTPPADLRRRGAAQMAAYSRRERAKAAGG